MPLLLLINSNLGSIYHRFRKTITYSLKLSIENCGQIAGRLHGYY